jgi:hypothetical protein
MFAAYKVERPHGQSPHGLQAASQATPWALPFSTAAYLLVAAVLGPTLWRERRRAGLTDFAVALVFLGIGILATIFGVVVLVDQSPVGGHVWPPFAACLIALIPPVLIGLARWQDRFTPLHRKVAGNCHLNRETRDEVAAAGFDVGDIRPVRIPGSHPLVRSGLQGVAIKTSS